MPKATVQQLIDAGFRSEQFGTPDDFAAADGYLARVIAEASGIVRLNVGGGLYDDTLDQQAASWLRLQRAELCAAKAELWTRRAAFIDSNASQGLDPAAAHLNRREYLLHAKDAQACAAYWIDVFLSGGEGPGEAPVTDSAGSVVVSGPFGLAGGYYSRSPDRIGVP